MNKYKVHHHTHYHFSSDVEISPHTLRLRPRENHEQHIEAFTLSVEPTTAIRWHRDVEGNSIATSSFYGPTKSLLIESECLIQKFDLAPEDFLIADYAVHYPFSYEDEDRLLLSPYLDKTTLPEIETFIAEHIKPAKAVQTFALLLHINQVIASAIRYTKRDAEGVQPPELTVRSRQGSCRDLAALFITVCQHLGLAARFVSGYVYDAHDAASATTHAWAEIYIPGAGWKGFDSTLGGMVGAAHIPVSVSRHPESVPPVEGHYYGDATATMDVDVWVTREDASNV